MKKIFMFAVCAMILTACTTKEEVVPPTSQEVRFYPTLTRATETAFVLGDQIGISAVHPSAGTELKASGNYADNVMYEYKGGQFVFVEGQGKEIIKLPDDGAGLAYYAVYPYQKDLKPQGTFAVKTDQHTHDNITASDFCSVYYPVSNEKDVHLKFWHRLSRIIVNIKDVPASKTVTMKLKNMFYRASFDLNANTYVAATGTSKSEIRMGDMGTTRDFEAILPPQAFTLGTDLIVTIGGEEIPISTNRPADTFYSGMEYHYDLRYIDGKIIPGPVIPVEFGGAFIYPWNTGELSKVVGGNEREDSLRRWMPIYDGNTPPNIEGCYFIDPFETVHCQDQGNGGYNPGDIVNSIYTRFLNQNISDNTIDYSSVSVSGSSSEEGKEAFIRGYGNNFTAFFNTEGVSSGITTKTALVISGTKTAEGIKDFYYAFVMVEKGKDPDGKLMKEGVFRVFRDRDFLAVNATWPGEGGIIVVEENRSSAKGLDTPWGIYDRKK